MKKLFFLAILNLMALMAWAQSANTEHIEMADKLRSSGKIYVVVLVLVIILTGLFIYLFNLDRKVSRLEKEVKTKEEN